MLGWVILCGAVFICAAADYEQCIQDCAAKEGPHKFSDNSEDQCSEFQQLSSQSKCGEPIETIVWFQRESPDLLIDPPAVKVKKCKGHCRNANELACKPKETKLRVFKVLKRVLDEKPICSTVEIEEHESCQCQCSVDSDECKEDQNMVYDPENCVCKCKNEDERKECDMAEDKIWKNEYCKCECKTTEECDSMHSWSEKDCRCIPNENNNLKRSATSKLRYHWKYQI